MPTKEQELTFENILEFFSLAEELLASVQKNSEDLEQVEILDRLNTIEYFVKESVHYSELIAENYSAFVNKKAEAKKTGEDISNQLASIAIALVKCREELGVKIKNAG